MDDAAAVRLFEPLADLTRDPDGVLDRQAVVVGPGDQVFDGAAGHVLARRAGLPVLFHDVEDGDDVGVVAEAGHGLGFVAHALQPRRSRPSVLITATATSRSRRVSCAR